MFGKRKTIPPRDVELAQDRGEFRPGLYDRDMQELREMLGALARKTDAVLDNQVKLDEVLRKVGLVAERQSRAVERTLATVGELEKTTVRLIVNVDALTQKVADVKPGLKPDLGERLDEAMNQLVASQQDVVGWLRKVTDRTVRDGKDEMPSVEEGQRSSVAGKEVAVELQRVIPMIVAGETAKAIEILSAIYSRLSSTPTEKRREASTDDGGSRKRTAGLRSSWQAAKGGPVRPGNPDIESGTEQKGKGIVEEGRSAKTDREGGNL